jgi:hypothetical protein
VKQFAPITGCECDRRECPYRFHWLPFTTSYWVVCGTIAAYFGSVRLFVGCWLATPLAIVVAWFVVVTIRKRRYRRSLLQSGTLGNCPRMGTGRKQS